MADVAWGARAMPWMREQLADWFDDAMRRVVRGPAAAADPESFDGLRSTSAALRASELFWVTGEMTTLARSVAGNVPAWTPAVTVPSPSGLLVWDAPLPSVAMRVTPHQQVGAAPLCGVRWLTTAGKVHVTFMSRADTAPAELLAEHKHISAAHLPLLDIDGLALSATAVIEPGTGGLLRVPLRLLVATWLLMAQPTLVDTRAASSAVGTGTGRPGRGPARDDVTLVDLRVAAHRHEDDNLQTGTGARTWQHRWVVRGHWRQQHVGPGRAQLRPVWVPPHVKGPQDAPLKTGDRVHVWRR